MKIAQGITACKQYCLAAGATQGNIAYTQTVIVHEEDDPNNSHHIAFNKL